jgi:DNA repair ATPase RecN
MDKSNKIDEALVMKLDDAIVAIQDIAPHLQTIKDLSQNQHVLKLVHGSIDDIHRVASDLAKIESIASMSKILHDIYAKLQLVERVANISKSITNVDDMSQMIEKIIDVSSKLNDTMSSLSEASLVLDKVIEENQKMSSMHVSVANMLNEMRIVEKRIEEKERRIDEKMESLL